MIKTRYYIHSDLIERQRVHPLSPATLNYSREKGREYYTVELPELVLSGEDWKILQVHRANPCSDIHVSLHVRCGGHYIEKWKGVFHLIGSRLVFSHCVFYARPKPTSPADCIEDYMREKLGLYEAGQRISAVPVGGKLERSSCYRLITQARCSDVAAAHNSPLTDCLPDPGNWCMEDNYTLEGGQRVEPYDCDFSISVVEHYTDWHRETVSIECDNQGNPVLPPFGTGWEVLSGGCDTGRITYWRCPSAGLAVPSLSNGILLSDILQYIVSTAPCGLTLRSNFFGINPEGYTPNNIAYQFADQNLKRLVFFHKSDVKRPDASNPSTSRAWRINPIDLLEDLILAFRLKVGISPDGSVWTIEHVSYPSSPSTIDLRGGNHLIDISYTTEEPRRHSYHYADRDSGPDFRANDIVYTCGEGEKENRLKLLSMDIGYTADAANADRVDDEGFVLVATQAYGARNIIIDGNKPLSWPRLHGALHSHTGLYTSGYVNNQYIDFLDVEPWRRGSPITTTAECCGFDPTARVLTDFGHGEVRTATHELETDTLTLNLTY